MPASRYLPSAQFIFIVSSIVLSGGLVLAANQFIKPQQNTARIATTNTLQSGMDWKTALNQIQSAKGYDGLPPASNTEALSTLMADAQTSNITNSIGRTLLLNLTDAKSQGLGSDIPTQDKLIADATARLADATNSTLVYTTEDLTLTTNTNADFHTYGNAFMNVIVKHPKADMQKTYIAFGSAVDSNDPTTLKDLSIIAAEHKALVYDMALIAVPSTLSPLHLQILNNFERIAETYADMQAVLTDPLRGLAGLQVYTSLTGETSRLFTNIAQTLSKDGILFSKDEPGSAWSVFLPQ